MEHVWTILGCCLVAAGTALALDDAKLHDIQNTVSNLETRATEIQSGGDTNELALIQDTLTKAKMIALAETRKRRLAGGNLPVPSFDHQLLQMIAQYQEAADRLQKFYDDRIATTNRAQ